MFALGRLPGVRDGPPAPAQGIPGECGFFSAATESISREQGKKKSRPLAGIASGDAGGYRGPGQQHPGGLGANALTGRQTRKLEKIGERSKELRRARMDE